MPFCFLFANVVVRFWCMKIDSVNVFTIVITGKQGKKASGNMNWYAGGNIIASGPYSIEIPTYGEIEQKYTFKRITDTTWSVFSDMNGCINIDAATSGEIEIFETIFFFVYFSLYFRGLFGFKNSQQYLSTGQIKFF